MDRRDKAAKLLEPFAQIADDYDRDMLDEHRPGRDGWKDPATIELFSGRGGKQLLTLAHCIAARDEYRKLVSL